MKIHRSLLIAASLIALVALPSPAFAGKKNKNKGGDPTVMSATEVLKKYDTNADGKIAGEESKGLQTAFSGADAAKLKHLDTNADGKLDENEIAAIKAPEGKKKKNK